MYNYRGHRTGLPGIKGTAGPPGPQGKQGPPGPRGEKGDSATAATEALKKEMSTLTSKVNSLQSKVNQQETATEALKKEKSTLTVKVNSLQSKVNQQENVLLLVKGVYSVGEKIFVSNGEQTNYNTAKAVCVKRGGQLASPRNAVENDAVNRIQTQLNARPFLGINDLQQEGIFKYPDGKNIAFSNWSDKEPNNEFGVEDCVEMYENGKWNDKNCNEKRLIVCEIIVKK
ncbi:pulmonary surfactant-associated protein D-like [Hyla sarda]|uniref:pulmonary surfactant-associated protein D-like n=1 Tax=Hyla sarda TaxID=327740 RepID=UPI0024C3211A|nr:pulmonary surfactant-associated protein D-like [Hyla sarda]